jgi:hypothetical protein
MQPRPEEIARYTVEQNGGEYTTSVADLLALFGRKQLTDRARQETRDALASEQVGTDGVYVSYAQADGSFRSPQFVVENFAPAQGWHVDQHPRLMAEMGQGKRADIVGFGDHGVHVSYSNPDGSFPAPVLAVKNVGYLAGNWRVGQHLHFVASLPASSVSATPAFG